MISLYIWKQVKDHMSQKVTYQDSINFETRIASENGYNFDHLDLTGFEKEYKTIQTRFGDLKIFKHGNGDKVVIYCHGILSNNRNAIKLLDYFIPRGYTVIAYDNFGWGESEKFGKCTLGVKEADLLKDVIDFVKTDLKPEQLIVYGESMGGGTVYSYLHKYSNQNIDKFVVDAGYNSFFDNVQKLAFDRVSYGVYLTYLLLPLLFKISKWPIKKFNKLEDFKQWDNVLHIHSKTDDLVSFKHTKKFMKNLKNTHVYETKTRHCLGIYYAREEHYKVLDTWLDVKKNKESNKKASTKSTTKKLSSTKSKSTTKK
ncbi:alpha/beta hydrolase [Mycoplasma yeatsii]|uniref:Alpha-beta hydrolase superfamily lysophospholipase n=1 Tax=Mycoplasma yeatsii TaxID=51365 RepID=A0ABU0NFC1_9MOLU|nr:alpha/beta fold hydrolase [Mycoplasma yeatsii]MDQ0567721.1 alpha-beta hydrolase superfamily lysophospholipase [Mycoplasma yeatsii]